MEYRPLITIITATYNSAAVLERSINSILNLKYRNIEYIVIDGASTDGTVDILKKYNFAVDKWISEPDNGIYDAWNKGVRLSTGEWITFLGSDDILYPDALQNYVDFLQHCPDLANLQFVSSKMHLMSSSGRIIKEFGAPWNWEKCRWANRIAHPGSLHRRVLFAMYGLFDEKYKICGDHEFLLRPGRNFKTAFMDIVTVRMAAGGVSSDRKNLFKEHFFATATTGQLNLHLAYFLYLWHLLKYFLKCVVSALGILVWK